MFVVFMIVVDEKGPRSSSFPVGECHFTFKLGEHYFRPERVVATIQSHRGVFWILQCATFC